MNRKQLFLQDFKAIVLDRSPVKDRDLNDIAFGFFLAKGVSPAFAQELANEVSSAY